MFEPHGVIPALVTPLDGEGKLMESSLKKVIDYTLEGGVHGEFILGSTGEFYGLDFEQKKKAIEITVEHTAGRVPVYAGASEITTRACIKLAKMAESIGVDALSVLTPYFISPTDVELRDHYVNIAESTKLPIVLYGNVGRTGVNISPSIVEELADVPNIVGIKDSSGDMTQMGEYIRRTRGKDFHVLAGRDTLILANLVYGGKGAIASTGNMVPRIVSAIYDSFVAGDLDKALDYQFKLAPLRLGFTLGTFPVVMKEALNMIGIDTGTTLPPVGGLTPENSEKLAQILKDLGVYGIAG